MANAYISVMKLGCAAALLSSSPALATTLASGGATIGASVPLVCEASASPISVDPDTGQAIGSVFEMCNGGSGFRIVASYRQLQAGERVTISYAGETVALQSSGMTAVAHMPGASLRTVPVAVASTGLAEGLLINIGFAVI